LVFKNNNVQVCHVRVVEKIKEIKEISAIRFGSGQFFCAVHLRVTAANHRIKSD
jgi:hypothetical protein